jgi:hypothetical protein
MRSPDAAYLPILKRGRHRRPIQGACFMEFASYLAGERWSDHPSCTHPLLAGLARHVNDAISDRGRQTLVSIVPDVIGLTTDDIRADVLIALRAAASALPVAAEERQLVLALALLNCERLLADLEHRPSGSMTAHGRAALAAAPGAAAWARRHGGERVSRHVFRRQTAPAIVRFAVDGIALACVCDADRRLHDLLVAAIEDCRSCRPADPAQCDSRATAEPLEPARKSRSAPVSA